MGSTPTEQSPDRMNLVAIFVASASVLFLALGSSFRQPFGDALSTNLGRVVLVGSAGGALALAGAIRRVRGAEEGPTFELAIFGAASMGAAGVAIGSGWLSAAPLVGGVLAGSVLGALGLGLARLCDRESRASNLLVAGLLGVFIAAAGLSASFGAEAGGAVTGTIMWLVGNAADATPASAGLAAALLIVALVASTVLARRGEAGSAGLAIIGPVALGFATGLVGVFAFIGSFVPRTVRALAPGASPAALLVASVVAGGASAAIIDAVPRFLIGGYALPFAVSIGMLAVPIYLCWNRARLRRLAGPASAAFEALELTVIGVGTAVAVGLVVFLTQVVRSST